MMNTSVAEVNLGFTNAISTAERTVPSYASKSDTDSFTKFMTDSAEKSASVYEDRAPVKQTQTKVDKPGRKDLDRQEVSDNKDLQQTGENKDPVGEVETKINEVKDAITEEFDVSEEELVAAMESLQMTMIDLLNPDMLKDLLLKLSGEEDMVSLLTNETLYADVTKIVDMVTDIREELKTELNLDDEEFVNMLESAKETKTEAPIERDIHVEVNRTEEARVADPISQSTVVKTETDKPAEFEQEEAQNENFSQLPQNTQTTQVHQVGDVVETVRQFTSYVNGEEVVRQVTDSIKVNISPETTSMELQLHPESLGTVNVNVTSQNGVVTAHLLVQDESVKAALELQLAQLQKTFEEQGTKVEAVEVAVASYNLDRGPFQDREDRQDRQNADRGRRRVNLNLNSPEADEISNLDEEDQLARRVMEMNGTSIDFSA